MQSIAHVALLVREYDEAITYFTEVLGFRVIEDAPLSEGKRWVLVRPEGSPGTSLLLAKAVGDQAAYIGKQMAGRVGFFLFTDDFARDYAALKRKGVEFVKEPWTESYGTVAVFCDLYGNRWDLLEPTAHNSHSAMIS